MVQSRASHRANLDEIGKRNMRRMTPEAREGLFGLAALSALDQILPAANPKTHHNPGIKRSIKRVRCRTEYVLLVNVYLDIREVALDIAL